MRETLLGLPAEVLVRICQHVDEAHAPSLLSFALASRHCHSIAKTVLFRTLTFHISTAEGLLRHTQACTKILRRNQAFDHVRRVVLVRFDEWVFGRSTRAMKPGDQQGQERGEGADDSTSLDDTSDPWHPGPAPTVDWDVTHQRRILGLPDDSQLSWRDWDKETSYDMQTAFNEAFGTGRAWEPLAELLRLLPGLVDLMYECPVQFPPCLLQVLRDRMPGQLIRLHLRNLALPLRLVGLDRLSGAVTVSPHDLAVLTSPCLHSIWLREPRLPSDPLPAQQAEAFLQILWTDGLAPNLRDLQLSQIPRYFRQPPPFLGQLDLCTWLPAELATRPRKQQRYELRHLELGDVRSCLSLTDAQLQLWDRVVHLNGLQSLKLSGCVDIAAPDGLLPQCDFSALTTLALCCTMRPSVEYSDNMRRFIRSLPRLEHLYIRNWDWNMGPFFDPDPDADPAADSDADSDGGSTPCTTVKTLWLDHGFSWMPTSRVRPRSSLVSVSEISRLGAQYPRVESLSLPIVRSWGDSDEVALYKAVRASFPRLSRLALTWKPPPEPPMDGEYLPVGSCRSSSTVSSATKRVTGVPMEHRGDSIVRDMANGAVDARLAQQIFEMISSPGLEAMMVRARRLGQGPWNMPWWDEITRAWLVDTVNPGREVRVKEIGRAPVIPDYWLQLPELIERAFRKVWPERKEGSKGWCDDWESFPLEE
ncbi:hypothetical protein NEMBOFW57_003582 [Staphylotrichum longicolle]|uniref:F-box domain-containing protein n=1 Tax=Staphylotrichum longicolle TaxID=669026 RepID=A0AAD4F600_9PEZI|nr:hypothetical protein NEMBOFW57_003582 [Staphylotrichum longicolle]